MNFCLWLTGLPVSGKSTIAGKLEKKLAATDNEIVLLNLDSIRRLITPSPKYNDEERSIVYRSLVIMAKLLVEKGGKNVIIDATGNRREYRELARQLLPEFAEVYVKCPLETCRSREASRKNPDVQKNLYKKAANGRLQGRLPGVASPYEEPLHPELIIDSNVFTPDKSTAIITKYIKSRWNLSHPS